MQSAPEAATQCPLESALGQKPKLLAAATHFCFAAKSGLSKRLSFLRVALKAPLDASFASRSQYCCLHHLVATRSVGPRRPERAGHLKNALTSSARRSTLSVPRILASLGTLI